jgi:hypothetical protein
VKHHFSQRFSETQEGTYPEIKLEVPRGTREIRVRYSVDPSDAVVDLGLADPVGLRGWSGGARTEITVTPANATPGYLPGLMRPGVWNVLLGLYRVPASGCEVRLEIEVLAATARHWYRGDLHSHTQHSDAAGSVSDLRAAALERGLDFLAVTDHNTVSHQAELIAQPGLIAGQEVTTYRGHFTALGPGPYLEFRHREAESVKLALETAFSHRMLRVLAHPKPVCPSCDWQWGLLEHFDAFEVWNGPWAALNWISRDRWVEALNQGLRLTAVGGSDRHQPCAWPDHDPEPFQVGSPTTWIESASLSPGDLLTAILEGRTSVSEGPNGPRVWLEMVEDQVSVQVLKAEGLDLLVFAGNDLLLECRVSAQAVTLELPPAQAPYLRAELRRAWSEAEVAAIQTSSDLSAAMKLDVFEQPCVAALSNALWQDRLSP